MPRAELTDVDFQALARFRHQLRKYIAFSEGAARHAGIEPRQHQVLLALRGAPADTAPCVQYLAGALALKPNTVSELVDRLEDAKLVRRERMPDDRRRARITISQHGLALLERLAPAQLDEVRAQAPELVGALHDVLRASRRSTPW